MTSLSWLHSIRLHHWPLTYIRILRGFSLQHLSYKPSQIGPNPKLCWHGQALSSTAYEPVGGLLGVGDIFSLAPSKAIGFLGSIAQIGESWCCPSQKGTQDMSCADVSLILPLLGIISSTFHPFQPQTSLPIFKQFSHHPASAIPRVIFHVVDSSGLGCVYSVFQV